MERLEDGREGCERSWKVVNSHDAAVPLKSRSMLPVVTGTAANTLLSIETEGEDAVGCPGT